MHNMFLNDIKNNINLKSKYSNPIINSFVSYYKQNGIIDSLEKSSVITKGIRWDLFVFGVFLILINIAGFLVFFVGLFVTIPTTMMAQAYVYRKLLSSTPGI